MNDKPMLMVILFYIMNRRLLYACAVRWRPSCVISISAHVYYTAHSFKNIVYFDCREWEVIDNDRQLKNSAVSWLLYVVDPGSDSRLIAKQLDPNCVDGSCGERKNRSDKILI